MPDVNPLLVPSGLPNEAPAFDKVKDRHFVPAVRVTLKEARANIRAIKNNPDEPTFANTILAFETADERFGVIMDHLSNEMLVAKTDELKAAQDAALPLRAKFATSVSMDKKLFARIEAVHRNLQERARLTVPQLSLLDDTYKGFLRSGIKLKGAARNRIKEISEEFATLGAQFKDNQTKANEAFILVIDHPDDLKGLPEGAVKAAAAEAEARDMAGKWVITLEYPSYGPFMDYAENRALREKLFMARSTRCWNDAHDNGPVIKRMVELRHEKATLLGYKNHASYVLEERMTGSVETVMKFLNDLKDIYKPGATEERKELQAYAASFPDGPAELKPWDVAFYVTKLKEEKYQYSATELRDYFPLDQVLDGCFKHFSRQFGVKFTENKNYPTKSPDIRGFDVTDESTGAFIGTIYTDFHPRKGKAENAWMTEYRSQGLYRGKIERPVTAIVCNFTKPIGNEQPYLDFEDEVITLFHEMGHALDGLLQEGECRSQASYRREWDSVELPSQVQEKWCFTPETLAMISRHKVTGESLPEEMIAKINNAKNFRAATAGLRQVGMGMLDMAWYTTDPAEIEAKYGFDVFKFEEAATAETRFTKMVGGPISSTFSHIFDGGYDAGYHGYAWADNLAADAYEYLTERKIYDTERLSKFRNDFIRHGGAQPAAVLYRNFRGQDPDPQALPRSQGLIPPKAA